MALPAIEGLIRRRILVNYRVDPRVIRPLVPARFEIATVDAWAIAGVCLIRLERMRPASIGAPFGFASENAAYRVAVHWTSDGARHDGVFVPRRDTSSRLQHRLGGVAFPGEYHHSTFDVDDDGDAVAITCRSDDGRGDVRLRGRVLDALPSGSVFRSHEAASSFLERGSIGYSSAAASPRLDGLGLRTRTWRLRPFAIDLVAAAYFDDRRRFPPGTIELDSAFMMRDVIHAWHALPPIDVSRP